jgi:hypothetical protein
MRIDGSVGHHEQKNVGPARVLLTVVHGTWAHGLFRRKPRASTTWFSESEEFSQSLKLRIEREGIRCQITRPCIWTGGNSMNARRRCALQLRRDQRNSALADPDAVRIIVAHSHGGAAAIRACSSLSKRYGPHGLVTLSTPFIVTEARELSTSEKILVQSASVVWTLLGVSACAALALTLIRFLLPVWLQAELGGFVEAIFATLTLSIFFWAQPAVLRAWKTRDRLIRIALRISKITMDSSRLLVVRAPGDEASLVLAAGDAVELANGFARKLLEAPVSFVSQMRQQDWYKWVVKAVIYLFLSSIGAAALVAFTQDLFSIPNFLVEAIIYVAFAVGTFFALFIGLCVAVAAALGVVAIASLGISSVMSVGYGPEYPFFGWELRTTAESSPLGISTLCHSLRLKDMNGLRHGVYRSEEARTLIADWIVALAQSCCEAPPDTRGSHRA